MSPSGTPWTKEGFLEHVSGLFVEAGRPLTARELCAKKVSDKTARRLFGTWNAAKERAWELAEGTVAERKRLEASFSEDEEIAAAGEDDWRKLIDQAGQIQKIYRKHDRVRLRAKVRLPDRMCAVVHSSDVHLGSVATNMEAWRRDTEFLLRTPDVYLITLGDLPENFTSFRTLQPVFEQVLPPKLQKKVICGYLNEAARTKKGVLEDGTEVGTLIAACWGTHSEEFDERLVGYSHYAEFKKTLCPFFAGQGLLELEVGKEKYTVLLSHASRFHSFLHALHGAKRLYQLTFPADVVVTGHTHVPAFERYSHYELARELGYGFGGVSYLVKCGSYKKDDTYSVRYFGMGVIGTPTIVFFPDHHEMLCFDSAERAVDFMKGVKAK